MDRCADVRELLSLHLEGELEDAQAVAVRDHLAGCAECAGLSETMAEIIAGGGVLADLEAPDGLASDLAASPCRLWLGLLFQAVDHEISPANLERLLTHLETCPACRATWQDLTLIHQVSEAMEPSQYLLKRCIGARERRPKAPPILNRRLAVAAAYMLAVVTSLIVGNPVTLARSQAAPAVERVAEVVSSEVGEVAAQGRGEVRVMLWRIWKWGEGKVETVRSLLGNNDTDEDSAAGDAAAADQGETS
jgi:predicted anti-sigma-YlaC factor YlaD